MLGRLADRVVRWRRAVIVAWVVLLAAGAGLGPRVFGNVEAGLNANPRTESVAASRIIGELRPARSEIQGLVDGVDVDAEATRAEISDAAGDLRALKGVAEVADYTSESGQEAAGLVATDRRATLIRVTLQPGTGGGGEGETRQAVIARLRAVDAPAVLLGGDAIARRAFSDQAKRDLVRGELVSLPILLVLLVVLFSGVIAAGIPLVVAVTAIAGGLLALLGISELAEITEYSINIVTMLGLGLAVDYSLLLVNRFREERSAGLGIEAAVRRMTETAGRTVLYSGLTVAACMLGLLLFAEGFVRSFAYGGVGVVLVAVAAALTLVPALLAVVGTRVKPAGARDGGGLFFRVSRLVQRAAPVIVVLVTAGLALSASPFTRAELANSGIDTLPPSNEARRMHELVTARFPGGGTEPVVILAEAGWDSEPLRDYLERLDAQPGVVAARALPLTSGLTLVQATPEGTDQGPAARKLVADVRAGAGGIDAPFRVRVTGSAAFLVDYRASLAQRLPWALGLMVLATLVLLFLMTGSVVVPIKAVAMAALSLGASFGALVWIFQDGHLAGLLGFEPTGYVDVTLPVLIGVFAFGLSMDYEIFLLARIKEAWDTTGDSDLSVAIGLARSGRIVTAAAILITVVFLGFAASDLLTVKQAGVGMAVAVVLDATIVRMLLVPATMKLMGRWNWWAPAPLARLHARFGLSESAEPPAAPDHQRATTPPELVPSGDSARP
jgi:RND superfamily putative drug exporter